MASAVAKIRVADYFRWRLIDSWAKRRFPGNLVALTDVYKLLSVPSLLQRRLKGSIERNVEAENIKTCEPKIRLYEDLAPETLRLALLDEFRERLFGAACKYAGSTTALARLMKVSDSTIRRYRGGDGAISYLFLRRLCDFLEAQTGCKYLDDVKKHVSGFRLANGRLLVVKIKEGEEFNFDSADGARVVAAFLGDGCLQSNMASYINLDATLRKKVDESIRRVVGDIPVKTYSYKEARYPQALAIILEKIGLPPGPKVYTNPSVPSWIKKSNDINVSRIFLRQFFSDEADVSERKGTINLPQSIDITALPLEVKKKLKARKLEGKNYERYAPRRLLDVKEMLWTKFGIRASGPYPVRHYRATRKGLQGERLKWRLGISGKADLEKFEREIGFDINYKQNALRNCIGKIKIYQSKKGFGLLSALLAAAEIEDTNGEITKDMISEKMKHREGTSQKWLERLVKRGLIVKVGSGKGKSKSFSRSPTRYRLTDKGRLLVKKFQNFGVPPRLGLGAVTESRLRA